MLQQYQYEELVALPESMGNMVVYEIRLDEYDWVNERLNGLFRIENQDVAFMIDYLGLTFVTIYLKIRDDHGNTVFLEGEFDVNLFVYYMTKLLELKISNLTVDGPRSSGEEMVIAFYNDVIKQVRLKDEVSDEHQLEGWTYDLPMLS
ncbi:hypothetical protein [Streptococcus moroccensis]|uniref:Uncharacterized protein n=1 Tax=Streptococcus moroccensis TaxID=1451356 RepID=A0ABT9YUD4_9STRE|nr:hypothetical protein [Streptococcus moroccensis]MDQ0223598.1 hypothetical protein [Streptococcus moroccensis]